MTNNEIDLLYLRKNEIENRLQSLINPADDITHRLRKIQKAIAEWRRIIAKLRANRGVSL